MLWLVTPAAKPRPCSSETDDEGTVSFVSNTLLVPFIDEVCSSPFNLSAYLYIFVVSVCAIYLLFAAYSLSGCSAAHVLLPLLT